MKRLLFSALICGVLVAAPAPGWASSVDEGVGRPPDALDAGVPGNVYEVRTLGSWREGNRAGAFRLVILRGGFDRLQTVVLVQWMAQALGEDAPEVVDEQRIAILDELGPTAVRTVRSTPEPNGLRLSIRIRHLVTGAEGEVDVFAGGPGQLTSKYTPTRKR